MCMVSSAIVSFAHFPGACLFIGIIGVLSVPGAIVSRAVVLSHEERLDFAFALYFGQHGAAHYLVGRYGGTRPCLGKEIEVCVTFLALAENHQSG